MRAIAAGLTDVGKQRVHNEDKFVLLPEFSVYVVADGMGGHQSGEVASRMAASTIASFFRQKPGPDAAPEPTALGEVLRAAVTQANARIFARADDSRAHRGMGTTIVAAAFHKERGEVYVAHAGDSRCYRLRGDDLIQLTRDHSLVSDALLERPDLSASDLAYLPRNVITRALGIAPTVDVDLRIEKARAGDVFLLCSDGLHGLVSDEEMAAVLRDYPILTEACAALVELANAAGGKDNITVVLVKIEADDDPWRVSPSRPG
jgi:protein phosphatase